MLFLAGDAGDGCYRIEKGLLKVSMVSSSGAERILSILGPGAIVGELAVLDGLPRSASVLALRDSELLFISKARFEECAKKNQELYEHLLTLLASRLRETNDVIAAESFLPLTRPRGVDPARACGTFRRGRRRWAYRHSAEVRTVAISPPWPVLRAKTSIASWLIGSGASW